MFAQLKKDVAKSAKSLLKKVHKKYLPHKKGHAAKKHHKKAKKSQKKVAAASMGLWRKRCKTWTNWEIIINSVKLIKDYNIYMFKTNNI